LSKNQQLIALNLKFDHSIKGVKNKILYLVKGKYSNAAFKRMVDSPQDQEATARKLFAAVGIEMQSTYFSVSSAEIVVVAEGIAESIAAVKMVTMSAGTFTGLEAIEVIDSKSMTSAMETAYEVISVYEAPNK
jgi:uncharacterized protein with GYD domain